MRRTCQTAAFVFGISSFYISAKSQNIEAVNFVGTPLSEAVEFFRENGNGLNFVVDPTIDVNAATTLRLQNVSLGAAVFCLVESMNLDFRMESHACFIVPKGFGKIALTPPAPPSQTANYEPAILARDRMIHEVVVDELPLRDVVAFLATAGSRDTELTKQFNLVIHGQVDPEIPIWLELRNSSVGDVLSNISKLTGLEIRVEPFAVFIDPPGLRKLRMEQSRIAPRPEPVPKRTPVGTSSPLSKSTKDPRKTDHPDHEDNMTRANMIYKWVNGRFTFVRYAGPDPEKSNLEEDPLRIFNPVRLEPIEAGKE